MEVLLNMIEVDLSLVVPSELSSNSIRSKVLLIKFSLLDSELVIDPAFEFNEVGKSHFGLIAEVFLRVHVEALSLGDKCP